MDIRETNSDQELLVCGKTQFFWFHIKARDCKFRIFTLKISGFICFSVKIPRNSAQLRAIREQLRVFPHSCGIAIENPSKNF